MKKQKSKAATQPARSKSAPAAAQAPTTPPAPAAQAISPAMVSRLLAGILLLTAAIYLPTLRYGFVYDDPLQISENPLITSLAPENIRHIFHSPVAAMYQPLTTLMYAVEYPFWKLGPAGYHFVNVLMHLLNVFLVFTLASLLFRDRRVGLVAALLFGVHPINVETVAWLSCRSSMLYGALFLLSLITYVRYVRETSAPMQVRWYAASILLFAFALLSKSAAMALPPLLFAFDYFLKRRMRLNLVWEKAPFFILAFIAAYAAVKIRGSEGYIGSLAHIFTAVDRFFLIVYSFAFYPFKAIVPVGFSAFYPYPVKTGAALPTLYYIVPLLLAAAGYGIYRLVKNFRLFAFLVLLYAIPVALSLQFVPVGKQITADRYAYIPCIGVWCLLALLFVRYLKPRRVIALTVLGLFTAVSAATTVMQSGIWKSNITLWTDVIEKAPQSDNGYLNRAIALAQEGGDLRTAFEDCNRAIALHSAFSNTEMAYNNRGNIWKETGNLQAALADYDSSIKYQPDFLIALRNRAEVRQQLGLFGPAVQDFDAALRIQPGDPRLLSGRAMTELMAGNFAAARDGFSRVLAADPRACGALNGRGIANEKLGDYDAARSDFAQAKSIDPRASDAWTNEGMMENDRRDYNAAVAALNQALALDPRNLQALINRAVAKRGMKDFAGAMQDLMAAHTMDTTFMPVFYERGVTHYEAGQYAEAAAAFSAYLGRVPNNPDAWRYAGLAFQKLNNKANAALCLERAAALGKQ